MKKFGTLVTVLLLAINISTAQKQITQGYVKMEITDVTTDNEQLAMQLEMMKGSLTEIYFDQNTSLTSSDMMGGMIKMKTFTDREKDNFDLTFDMMGQKMWINEKLSSMGSDPKKVALENSTKVTVDKNNTKTILGYKCYEFTVTSPELEGISVKGYLTEDIKAVKGLLQNFPSLELAGFPIEYSLVNPTMSIKMTSKEIKTTVDPSKMVIKTDGFKKLTMAEFQKQMGGMGGFGF